MTTQEQFEALQALFNNYMQLAHAFPRGNLRTSALEDAAEIADSIKGVIPGIAK